MIQDFSIAPQIVRMVHIVVELAEKRQGGAFQAYSGMKEGQLCPGDLTNRSKKKICIDEIQRWL